MREKARHRKDIAAPSPGALSFRLPFRKPFAAEPLFERLVATAVPGVEEFRDGVYRRSLRLPNGNCIAELTPTPDYVACRLILDDVRDLTTAIARCRRLLDLDADPEAVDAALSRDEGLAALVRKHPGTRIRRTVDEVETAVRIVLGQQVSLGAARTHAGRLVAACGAVITDPGGGLTHTFPSIEALAAFDCATLRIPAARQRTMRALIDAAAAETVVLDAGADWNLARAQLLALPGVGHWTAEMIAMRGLGDPDAFPATDMWVVKAAQQLGISDLASHAVAWRPWRAYATHYLWEKS
jgi:AraC family transcriptional regulator of adaptative response / DNA-3-methyladenine glycosylase II